MPISESNKHRLQTIIAGVESDNFDLQDIYYLLINLRSYCGNHRYFREIADFIAHDERDRGITFTTMERQYLLFCYAFLFPPDKQPLDLTEYVPIQVKYFYLLRASLANPNELNAIGYTRKSLESDIEAYFELDNAQNPAFCRVINDSKRFETALQLLGNSFDINPAFTEDEAMKDLISVIQTNNFIINTTEFAKRKHKIVLCMLMLMHDTTFTSRFANFSCEVSADDNFLGISAIIPVNTPTRSLNVKTTMFKTSIPKNEWCTESFFTNTISKNIQINSDFKLEKL